MSSKKPVVLVIRDGWGRNPLGPDVAKEYGDATVLADTPFTDYLLANYPHSLLGASGEDVGLREARRRRPPFPRPLLPVCTCLAW